MTTDEKVKLFYTGPDGDVNYDVADEIGEGARLKHRRHYTVSKDLALQLLTTSVWQETGGPGALTKEARAGKSDLDDRSDTTVSGSNPVVEAPVAPPPEHPETKDEAAGTGEGDEGPPSKDPGEDPPEDDERDGGDEQ